MDWACDRLKGLQKAVDGLTESRKVLLVVATLMMTLFAIYATIGHDLFSDRFSPQVCLTDCLTDGPQCCAWIQRVHYLG